MMRIFILLSATMVVAWAESSTRDHGCESLVPQASDAEHGEPDVQIPSISLIPSKRNFKHGDKLTVNISSHVSEMQMSTFILQARRPMDTMPRGTWEVNTPNLRLYECTTPDDTVGNDAYDPTGTIQATWVSPSGLDTDVVYEITFGFANPEGKYWTGIQSTLVHMYKEQVDESEPSPVPTGETDEENKENEIDMHDGKREEEQQMVWLQKVAQMTIDEDAESEGDWTKRRQQERQEHEKEMHDEMMQYEEGLQREEDDRQARIRAEIVDKEEWEKEQKERGENDRNKNKGLVGGTDSAGCVTANIAMLLLSLVIFYVH